MPIAREIVSAGVLALAILRGLGRQDGKIFALCMIWRPRARKEALPGKIFTMCIPKQRFAELFGYTAHKSCQNQLILDTYRRYVATKGRFSVRGLFCHTSSENLATDKCLGMH